MNKKIFKYFIQNHCFNVAKLAQFEVGYWELFKSTWLSECKALEREINIQVPRQRWVATIEAVREFGSTMDRGHRTRTGQGCQEALCRGDGFQTQREQRKESSRELPF